MSGAGAGRAAGDAEARARGPILVTARDAPALRAAAERALGASLPWVEPDDPRAAEAVVWFASSAPPDPPLRLPALEWIHSGWAGVDRWLGRPEWGAGVTLTRTVADFPERIAAYVMAHLLAEALDLPRAWRQQEARRWSRWTPGTLAGTTMLIVGHGAIGRAVAGAARGFGIAVRGVRRGPVTAEERAAGVEEAGALERLLPEADIVVNLLPATPETDGFWSAARFARLKRGAVFVNASRGRCVDEGALLAALDADPGARAILDVFREEPLPEGHPFWSHPRVRVTPHVAGIGTPDSEGRAFAENWPRWTSGAPLLHVVERDRGY
ncbi:MAG TPA: D-2-hydroxyacid dehydrogenase [Acidobacteriota bacterium]|nr:D-2-hydroxyacid dehydrogenase [Acidobacteriota bacterium]